MKNKSIIIGIVMLFCSVFLMGCSGSRGLQGGQGPTGDKGNDGKSAYDIWIENGNTGTEEEFLSWLKGSQGDAGLSAYETYKNLVGKDALSEIEWIASLVGTNGENGQSAYDVYVEVALSKGEQIKSQEEWLDSLIGKNGTDGIGSIAGMEYVSIDKWGIAYQLQMIFKSADDKTQTILTNNEVKVIDSNKFYVAESSDEIWNLISYGVKNITIDNDIIWLGNQYHIENTRYIPDIELTNDLNFSLNGYNLYLDASGIKIKNSAKVRFQNGNIWRVERSNDEELTNGIYNKIKITNHEVINNTEYGFSTDEECALIEDGIYTYFGGITPVVEILDFSSLDLDRIEFYSVLGGIYIGGVSSSLKITNSTIKCEGLQVIATLEDSMENNNISITIEHSLIKTVESSLSGIDLMYRENEEFNTISTGAAISLNMTGTLDLLHSTFIGRTQAIILRGGKVSANNSYFECLGGFLEITPTYEDMEWEDRTKVPNAVIVLGNRKNDNSNYAELNLTNCTINKNEETKHQIYIYGNNEQNAGSSLVFDAMTFYLSCKEMNSILSITTFEENSGSIHIYHPTALLNVNEWYNAQTMDDIKNLLDLGAKKINILNNINLTANIWDDENKGYTLLDKDVEFVLNGYALNITSNGIIVKNNSNIVFQNGFIVINKNVETEEDIEGDYAIKVNEYSTLKLNDVKLYSNRSGILLNGQGIEFTCNNSEIYAGGYYGICTNENEMSNINSIATICQSQVYAGVNIIFPEETQLHGKQPIFLQDEDNTYGVAVIFNVNGTLKIEYTYLAGYTQGIIIRDGIASIENSKIEVTGNNTSLDQYIDAPAESTHNNWGKGFQVPSAAVVIGTYHTLNYQNGNYLYQNHTEVILRNTKLIKTSGKCAYVYAHNDVKAEMIVITYDKFTVWKSMAEGHRSEELITFCETEKSNIEIWDERNYPIA